nr:PREDICTED: zinc finger CCCH-type with G patch domain-containing protein [Bemisia tabaci]
MAAEEDNNIEALKSSLAQYKTQLSEIEEAIKSSSDESTKGDLVQLGSDIQELISLTEENLSQLESASRKKAFQDELAQFDAEIENLEGSGSNEPEASNLADIQNELEHIVGSKCQAPFDHFGESSYHNALVINVETPDEVSSMDDIMVQILFVNPIYKNMVPCPYFLEGDCKFSADQCHFSHGHAVPFIELKEYKEPDFSKAVPGCAVLAKMGDGLWKRAILISRLDDTTCSVKLESSASAEMEIQLQDILPLETSAGEDLSDSDSSSSSEEDGVNNVEELDERKLALINETLLNPQTRSALGAWEKHTKGIGSKLMASMGYIAGTGLGKNSDGKVDPVEAVVFPTGKSLDYCMKLKESSGDKDLFQAERRRKRHAAKMEKARKHSYEREKQRGFFFSFLNEQLAGPSTPAPTQKSNVSLKNSSLKGLNVDSMRVGEDIKRVSKDIVKLKESLSRHATGSAVHSSISNKLRMAQNELFGLQNRENSINKEKSDRKSREKMSVF